MILEAYLDDSGSGGRPQRFFILAGFLSDYGSWATFSDEWKGVLDEPPAIPFFKMNHAYAPNSRKSVFRGWDRVEIDKKVARLISIIKHRVMVRLSSKMSLADYEMYVKGRIPHEIDSPYFFCFYQIIYSVAVHYKKYGWNFKTDFFFDEQGTLGDNTKQWHEIFKSMASEEVRPYIGSPPIFCDDIKFMPLQAADLYVGAMRKHAAENEYLYLPMRTELKQLLDYGPQNIEREIGRNQLREWLAQLPAVSARRRF
jgi:hypothetical protein